MIAVEAEGTEELHGRIMVSVHNFADMGMGYTVLATVIGDIGNKRPQAETRGDSIHEALVLAVETLFLPREQ